MAPDSAAGMKVLLAIDGSEGSLSVIREIGRRPWPAGTELRVITVDAPLGPPMLGVQGTTAYDVFVSRQRAEAERSLQQGETLLRSLAPDATISSALLEGSAASTIIAEAARWGSDLVAIGSRGRSAVKSVLLGSVSLEVVINAPCSVEVVRSHASDAS